MFTTIKWRKRAVKISLLLAIAAFAFSGLPIKIVQAIACREESIVYQRDHSGVRGWLDKLVRAVVTPQALAAQCPHGQDKFGGDISIPYEPPPNQSPIAIAGGRYWSYANEEVRLSGYGTDPDGAVVLYEWDKDGDGTFEWSSSNSEYRTSYTNVGTYSAVFRVTDNRGAKTTDSVLVDIHTPCPSGSGTSCHNVTWNGIKWDSTVAANGIKFVVDLATIPGNLSKPDTSSVVRQSFQTWDGYGRNINFIADPAYTDGGVNGQCQNCGTFANNGVNTVFWSPLSAEAPKPTPNSVIFQLVDMTQSLDIGLTQCFFEVGDSTNTPNYYDPAFYLTPFRKLVDCDIKLNSSVSWSIATPPATGSYDVRSIATHEIGHWLQLADLYGTVDQDLMMYGNCQAGPWSKRNLGTGDIYGIQYLYGG